MPDVSFPYPEETLQYIWRHLLFELSDLKTTQGSEINIINAGVLNQSSGPDFKHAEIRIGGKLLSGDIEIHVRANDWYSHAHHTDRNYNKVILHVVADVDPVEVSTQSGKRLPVLNILDRLDSGVIRFVENLNSTAEIPCSPNFRFISEAAFTQQLEKAHEEYFEQKTNDLIAHYNPDLNISDACKNALIISVFDGLGIPHNRKQMTAVARWLINSSSAGVLPGIQDMLNYCGFGKVCGQVIWSMKGVYPANHPRSRVIQAYRIAEAVRETDFSAFYKKDALSLWSEWTRRANIHTHYKSKVLFATVFLPALYLCSSLVGATALKSEVMNTWRTYTVELPYSIRQKLRLLPKQIQQQASVKLGAVHHLRAYCGEKRCHECFVLKKGILS